MLKVRDARVVVSLALLSTIAACGGTATPTSSVDVGQGSLTGAGATFPEPFYSKAFYMYNQSYPQVSVNYQAVGSGAGIQQFTKGTVDFGASDVPMQDSDIAVAGGPDSLVQIAHLVTASRSGDILLSASRDWDYRARYEPIPHVSSHGALHREHMMVPLLLNRPPARTPRRTVDTMPSALTALGITPPKTLEGVSFF